MLLLLDVSQLHCADVVCDCDCVTLLGPVRLTCDRGVPWILLLLVDCESTPYNASLYGFFPSTSARTMWHGHLFSGRVVLKAMFSDVHTYHNK